MTEHSLESSPPRLGVAQIRLLEKLCNACGISGNEGEVRKIVLEQVKPYAGDVVADQAEYSKVDAMGNVLVTRRGRRSNGLRVMLAAHMDEVGFMLTHDEKDGIFRFEFVGGLDARLLAGKAVVAGKDHAPGVIGAAPIHLTTASDRQKALSVDDLRIDASPKGSGLKPGDQAVFAPNFLQIGRGASASIRSKALDDRVGVATLIELVKHAPETIDLLAAFTVQEEVGLRGAQTAAYAFDPHIAIALDCTPAYDLPNWEDEENTRYNTRLGAGPALYLADRGTLSDPRLIRHFGSTGDALGIPYQFRQPGGGGTDAGAMHKVRAGVPGLSVSVPGRYLHTPAALIRLADWRNTFALIHAALSRLTPALLENERQ